MRGLPHGPSHHGRRASRAEVPLVPGHQVVGSVVDLGPGVSGFSAGQRVGIPWLGFTCGTCAFCMSGRENLCLQARFTGYHEDGGYAEYAVADARFCFPLPAGTRTCRWLPFCAAGSSATVRFAWRGERRGGSDSTGSDALGSAHPCAGVPLPGPGGVCLHAAWRRERPVPRAAPGCFVGSGTRSRSLPFPWMRQSYSLRTAPWFPRPFGPWTVAGRSSAPEST